MGTGQDRHHGAVAGATGQPSAFPVTGFDIVIPSIGMFEDATDAQTIALPSSEVLRFRLDGNAIVVVAGEEDGEALLIGNTPVEHAEKRERVDFPQYKPGSIGVFVMQHGPGTEAEIDAAAAAATAAIESVTGIEESR